MAVAARTEPGRLVNIPAEYQPGVADPLETETRGVTKPLSRFRASQHRAGAGSFTIEHDDDVPPPIAEELAAVKDLEQFLQTVSRLGRGVWRAMRSWTGTGPPASS